MGLDVAALENAGRLATPQPSIDESNNWLWDDNIPSEPVSAINADSARRPRTGRIWDRRGTDTRRTKSGHGHSTVALQFGVAARCDDSGLRG